MRVVGGAPPTHRPKAPAQSRCDAASALRAFYEGPFPAWRQRVPPGDLARDVARLVAKWTSAGVDVGSACSAISDALKIPTDQTLEVLWAWELVAGFVYDPTADTFTQPMPMDVDPSAPSPLDEVAQLRRELERVTQEAASLRAHLAPPPALRSHPPPAFGCRPTCPIGPCSW